LTSHHRGRSNALFGYRQTPSATGRIRSAAAQPACPSYRRPAAPEITRAVDRLNTSTPAGHSAGFFVLASLNGATSRSDPGSLRVTINPYGLVPAALPPSSFRWHAPPPPGARHRSHDGQAAPTGVVMRWRQRHPASVTTVPKGAPCTWPASGQACRRDGIPAFALMSRGRLRVRLDLVGAVDLQATKANKPTNSLATAGQQPRRGRPG
jgi:hypothetical protein